MDEIPQVGDRILVLKWPWLELILLRRKTIEVRGVAFRRGRYFLGFKRNVYGWVEFGDPMRIASVEQWHELRHLHRVESPSLLYKRTFGCPIRRAQALGTPVPFTHPKGAVGIVKYR